MEQIWIDVCLRDPEEKVSIDTPKFAMAMASFRAPMKVIGNEGCQEVGRHLNNRAENSHLHFEGGSERCSDSGKCEVFRNSSPSIPPSTTTSITKGKSSAEPDLRTYAPPPFSNGANFLLPKSQERKKLLETGSHESDSTMPFLIRVSSRDPRDPSRFDMPQVKPALDGSLGVEAE